MSLDYYDMQGNRVTLQEWCRMVEKDDDARRVAWTDLPGGVRVSTVLLGIDHGFGEGPPVIFESMVFGPDDMIDLDFERYCTKEEAELGHDRMVTRWTGWTPGDPRPEDARLSPLSELLEMLTSPEAEHATSPDSMVVMYPKDSPLLDLDPQESRPALNCPTCGRFSRQVDRGQDHEGCWWFAVDCTKCGPGRVV